MILIYILQYNNFGYRKNLQVYKENSWRRNVWQAHYRNTHPRCRWTTSCGYHSKVLLMFWANSEVLPRCIYMLWNVIQIKWPVFSHNFTNEYLALNHISLCSEDIKQKPHYFFSHHGVIKDSSSTMELQTMFDTSCKSSFGIALNDICLQVANYKIIYLICSYFVATSIKY